METVLRIDADVIVVPVVVLFLIHRKGVIIKSKSLFEEVLLIVRQDVLVVTRRTEHWDAEFVYGSIGTTA